MKFQDDRDGKRQSCLAHHTSAWFTNINNRYMCRFTMYRYVRAIYIHGLGSIDLQSSVLIFWRTLYCQHWSFCSLSNPATPVALVKLSFFWCSRHSMTQPRHSEKRKRNSWLSSHEKEVEFSPLKSVIWTTSLWYDHLLKPLSARHPSGHLLFPVYQLQVKEIQGTVIPIQ
jgi:hypothetical protein